MNGKNYLKEIASIGLVGGQLENLQQNVRAQQAQSGLLYGGAPAGQEARTIGQVTQNRRLQASMQLADLTRQEALLPQEIEGLMAETEAATGSAAAMQTMAPVRALGDLYGGAQSGLSGIFGIFGGMV